MNKKLVLSVLSTAVVASMASAAMAKPGAGFYVGGDVDKYYSINAFFDNFDEALDNILDNMEATVFVDGNANAAPFLVALEAEDINTVLKPAQQSDFEDNVYENVEDPTKPYNPAEDDFEPVPVGDLVVESVSAINLKQVEVKFSQEVNKDLAEDESYYTITGDGTPSSVSNAKLLDDNQTVLLTLDAAFDNQTEKFALTVDGDIKNANGVKLGDDFTQYDISLTDLTLPGLASVKATGNKTLVVTFTEPIKNNEAQVPSSYTIDGQLFSASSIVADADEVTYTITLANPLAAGQHTLKLAAGKFTDYANLKNAEVSSEFTVDAVTTAPTATVVSATTSQVVVKFERELKANPTIKFGTTSASVSKDTTDKTKFTADFGSDVIPYAGGKIVITNVEDLFGNKATDPIELNVTPSIDSVKPTLVGITSEKEGEIVVEFSEEIKNPATATFTVKDKDNKAVSGISVGFAKTDAGKDIKTKALIKGSFVPTGSPYKVSVSGIKDLANNPMDAVVDQVVSIADKTAPTVVDAKADTAKNKIAITFNEQLDLTAATNVANYKIEVSGTGIYALPGGSKVELTAGGKVAIITLPSSWKVGTATKTISDVASVYLSGLKDVANNVMADQNVSVSASAETLAKVTKIEAVATDKIEITLDTTGVLPTTLYAGDFVVYGDTDADGAKETGENGTVTVANATINKNVITLTLADKLTADAKIGTAAAAVNLSATPAGTKTALGTDFALTGANAATDLLVTDLVAPAVITDEIEVAQDGTLEVTIPLTEDVAGASADAGDEFEKALLVKVDGKVLAGGNDFTVAETAGEVVVTFVNSFDLTQNIEISLPESAALQGIVDGNNNVLGTVATQVVSFDFDNAVAGKVEPVETAVDGTDYKVVNGVLYLQQTWVDANKATAPNGNDYVEIEVQDAAGNAIDLSSTAAGTYSYTSGDGNNWTAIENNTDTTLWAKADSNDLKYLAVYNTADETLHVVQYQILSDADFAALQ